MPRMDAPSEGPKAAPWGFSETLGAWLATWAMLVSPRFSSIWALTAVMAIGVCCTFWRRNWAVTTTSPTVLLLLAVVSGAFLPAPAPWAAPPPGPASWAAAGPARAAAKASAEAPRVQWRVLLVTLDNIVLSFAGVIRWRRPTPSPARGVSMIHARWNGGGAENPGKGAVDGWLWP